MFQMLRAAGKFKRSSYPLVSVTPEDEGSDLEEKWEKWAAQESYKRCESPQFHYLI